MAHSCAKTRYRVAQHWRFRTDTPEFRQYEEIDRRFPSSEYDVLVVVEGTALLSREKLEAFRNAVVELQLTDGVGGLVSMLSARNMPDASGYASPVVPDENNTLMQRSASRTSQSLSSS